MSKKDVKKANTEVKLTAEEKEELKGNEEGIRQVLINKAILDTAKKYEFTPEEKEEFDYHFKNEKAKFFIAKEIEGKISVNEDEEINKLIQEMKKSVEVTKEEILFSKGNPDIIKGIVIGKVIERKMKETDFEKKEEENIKIIESNVYINFYLDLQVRKNVVVTQKEVSDIYEAERGKLGNITPNDAYNQIANGLLNNKANEERMNIVNKISEEYKVEDLVKENLK